MRDHPVPRPEKPALHHVTRLVRGLLLFLFVFVALMCASSESHIGETKLFLNECDAKNPCLAPGQDCYCVCTIPCTTNNACKKELEGSGVDPKLIVCKAPACGAASESDQAVCDVVCSVDADCKPLSPNHTCDSGYCRAPASGKTSSAAAVDPKCPKGGVYVADSSPFCLEKEEVTVSSYRSCITTGECTEPSIGNLFTAGTENHPINAVTPTQAEAYCASVGARLPTRAEWQFAATNGGTTTYPWGETVPGSDSKLVCALAGEAQTCPVASIGAGNSKLGISDLVGNVAEIVTDGAGYCLAGGYFGEVDATLVEGTSCVTFTDALLTDPTFEQTQLGFRCVFPSK